MKKLLISLLSVTLLSLQGVTYGQAALELSWNGSWSPSPGPVQGPTVNSQTQTFQQDLLNNADFSDYTPALTVTTSLRNQVYTGLHYGNVSTGLSFGAQKSEWDDPTILTQSATAGDLYGLLGANVGAYGPTASMYRSLPTAATGTIDADYSQFGQDANGGVNIFSTVEPLQDLGADKAGRYEYGELVITFSRPVKDPVLHIASLGGSTWYLPVGSVNAPGNWKMSYFTTELELQTPGYTSTRLSGTPFFDIEGNNILNNATKPNGDSQVGDVTVNGESSYGAASGSIQITGTVTQLIYKVYVRGSAASDFNFSFDKSTVNGNRDPFYGDYWAISYSLAKPTQQVSGNVFVDKDGLTDNNINQSAGIANDKTNAGGLYANLLNTAGQVVATTSVYPNGTYLFDNVPAGTYSVQLTTNAGTGTYAVPVAAPATVLPDGWVNTGEFIGSGFGSDGTVNGNSVLFTVSSGEIKSEVNFGLDHLPESVSFSTPVSTPYITQKFTLNSPSLPVLSGSDPEDQPSTGVLTGKTLQITTIPNNSDLLYNNVLVTVGQVITNFDPALLQIQITVATMLSTFTEFKYAYIDAAGFADPTPANYRISWTSGGTLPVRFTNLNGSYLNGSTLLSWASLTELNFSHYEVEHSVNGVDYSFIGRVEGTGNSTTRTDYSFIHRQPVAGINYYRLKFYDKDGNYSYSNIIAVMVNAQSMIITSVYPNPFVDRVHVTVTTDRTEKVQIRLLDNLGRLIRSQQGTVVSGLNLVTVSDLKELPSGSYVIEVKTESSAVVRKLIK
jgi:hypothetical protein